MCICMQVLEEKRRILDLRYKAFVLRKEYNWNNFTCMNCLILSGERTVLTKIRIRSKRLNLQASASSYEGANERASESVSE
jgi:hypothetical protein